MRIIFLDIDGTIIDCCRGLDCPSNNTINMIKTLQAQGDIVLIVSGRPKCLLDTNIINLNTDGLILANGSYIEYHGQKLFENLLEPEAVSKIVEFGLTNQCPFYLETNDYVYTQDKDSQLHHDYFDEWKLDEKVKNFSSQNQNYLAGMMALYEDEQLMQTCEKHLIDYVDVTRQNGLYAYDLNAKGINKGSAILKFLDLINQNNVETFAFGDGENDLSMMRSVDHPIAMGNACDCIKEICEYVTDDVIEDGVFNALKHYHVIQ